MRARAPASTANIGPGFDALALALSLYVEVDITPAESFSITTSGAGADFAQDRNHMAARIAIAAQGHDRMAIRVHSDIPVGRGLGSSAALAAAAAAAAGAPDPFRVAADTDGHPENAAASVLGGLVAATMLDDGPMATRLPLDPGLAFVVMVPDRRLATAEARAALPAEVPHRDAAFNLGHLALLIAGLGDGRLLAPEMTEDRLHQPYRTALFPESAALMRGVVDRGALASCWSGAGPSLLAICDRGNAGKVRDGAAALLDELGVAGNALLLEADVHGLQVDRDIEPLKE